MLELLEVFQTELTQNKYTTIYSRDNIGVPTGKLRMSSLRAPSFPIQSFQSRRTERARSPLTGLPGDKQRSYAGAKKA